jgi:NADPH-dependent 2,4-dienoyl-CoA reductase/sulfur reductase-like enzyme
VFSVVYDNGGCVFRPPSAGRARNVSVSFLVPRQGRSAEKFSSHHTLPVACSRRIASPHARHHDIKLITSMEKEGKRKREKVIVVGAGPVGSLAALYAANRGNDVEVYELRGGKLRK